MLYELNFFENKISEDAWRKFIYELERFISKFELKIVSTGTVIKFYLETAKDISQINGQIFPLAVIPVSSLPKEFDIFRNALPDFNIPFFYGTITDFLSGLVLKKSANAILVKLSKSKFLPWTGKGIEAIFISNGRSKKSSFWLKIDLAKFLSFDLSNNINFSIEKIRADLKDSFIPSNIQDEKGIFQKGYAQGRFTINNFDFFKHTLVVGQSGSGKSVLLEQLIKEMDRLSLTKDYSVLLIDPHGVLWEKFSNIEGRYLLDFQEHFVDIFANQSEPLLSSELSMGLILSMIETSTENTSLERVLRFSLFTLFKNKNMSIENLVRLLKDLDFRKTEIEKAQDENIRAFFETEFAEYVTQRYSYAILPIINFATELQLVNLKSQGESNLADIINNNFLTVVSIPQTRLGEKPVKTIGGSLIQQLFIAAQSGKLRKKVILMVDEFAVVQNPTASLILSQARKFDLSVFLTQQYLGQIQVDVLKSIYANTVNYFVFKEDREDAERMSHVLNLEIKDVFLKNKDDPREKQELGIELLSTLNIGECIMRVMKNDRYLEPIKVGVLYS